MNLLPPLPPLPTAPPAVPEREWQPRMWLGSDLFAWLHLLARNHFAVPPAYWYILFVITCVSPMHTALRWLQSFLLGRRVDHTPIRRAPLFIIGHWRTGTTLLHEMLILDDRHNCPNTYQCLEPNHFLLTENIFPRLFPWLMPTRRPMDNMGAGWDKPQEDEFALCMLGQPSPYLTIAFPNHPPQDQEAFDLETLSPAQQRQWKIAFVRFLRQLTYRDPRRLILKSPTHSCRIPTLLELFPDAQFVHIVRDPFVVFPSTVNLWKSLYQTHGLQTPNFRGLDEYVFNTFNHLYQRLDEGIPLIPPGQFHELRYEDLIADPLGEMRLLYDKLGLGTFEQSQQKLEKYLNDHTGYRTNRYPPLSDELRDQIRRRWGTVIEKYGYGEGSAS
jgi:omega-hydroxy-beta-dihydromenaquinone-9 sulfotransferase